MASIEAFVGVPQRVGFAASNAQREALPINEIATENKFRIRGHHLAEISWLQRALSREIYGKPAPWSVELLADYRLKTYLFLRRQAFENINKNGGTEEDRATLRYVSDVVGNSEWEFERARDRAVDLYNEFRNLRDDDEIEIVASSDSICKATCKTGAHCRIANALYGKVAETRRARDMKGIELFSEEAKRLGVEHQVTTFQEMTDYADIENAEVACLKTNAKALKYVLLNSRILEDDIVAGPDVSD